MKLKPDFQIRRIDRMLKSGDYDWAEDTLKGIRSTIKNTDEVTKGQVRAIGNIQRGIR